MLRVASALVALLALGVMTSEVAVITAGSGQESFRLLTRIMFWIVYYGGALLTADSLAAERRDGTLGLLFLTDLKGYDVVLGKVTARFIPGLFSVLAIVPMLAIPMLMGGVSAGEFWRTVSVLVLALLFSASVGIAVSVLFRSTNGVTTAAMVVLFLLASLPKIFTFAFPASAYIWNILWSIQPAGALWASDDAVFKAHAATFVVPLVATICVAALLLVWACLRVSSSWQTGSPNGFWLRLLNVRTRVLHGNTAQRLALRRRLLDIHPLLWIHGRLRLMPRVLLAYLGVLAGLTTALCWSELYPWNDMSFALAPLIFLHLAVLAMVACEAANCFPRLTANGAAELLLCTSLSNRDLVEGHLLTLRRLFRGPFVAVFLFTAVWLITALFRTLPELRVFAALAACCCVAMLLAGSWAAALYSLYTSVRPRLLRDVAGRSILLVLGAPWIWYSTVSVVMAGVKKDDLSQWVQFTVLSLVHALAVAWWSRRGLYRDLRRVITRDGT